MIDIGADLQNAFDEGYEKGKADEHRWWSEHCANCTDADRPQGEWIKDEDGTYRCSNCGGCEEQFIYGTENWYGRGESKFCPSCGTRMLKGADDEA